MSNTPSTFNRRSTEKSVRESTPQFRTIASKRQEVARFDGDQEIVLYHDNSAGDRDLSFVAVPDENEDSQSRTDRVQCVAKEVAGNYFNKEYQDHIGRPDVIVLEIISEDSDYEYLVVEIKNSANEDIIRRGIKETLEYLAFLRLNEEYVFGRDDEKYFGSR